MNKTHYLTLSGLFLIAVGIILLFSKEVGIESSKVLVPISFGLSGIFSFLFSKSNSQHKIAKQFHLIQAIGILVFAAIIVSIPETLKSFLSITTYFILVFGLFEITYTFAVLNSKSTLNKNILFSRLIAGIVNLIGGFILMLTLFKNTLSALLVAGILILIGGLSMVWFSTKIKK